jgi:hypothetical protein
MNNKNLDQALAALGDALKSQDPNVVKPLTPLELVSQLPKRALSGDHIVGGKILKFASAGITDSATKEQLVITDSGINIIGTVDLLTANIIKVDVLEVKELRADVQFEKDQPIVFADTDLYGKGLLWKSKGSTKQFVFNGGPDKFFSSEIIDIARGKYLSMDGVKVLDGIELGPSVTKSNLREVGRLKGLMIDGSLSVNNYMFFNGTADRLGLGTDQPNSALSVAEDGIEVLIGTKENRGLLGTFASHALDIVTDNTVRISLSANGNIQLGNTNQPPVQVSMHGKLAIKVAMPDPEVDLHVNGAVKFNGKLQKYDNSCPTAGAYNQGDIVWNSNPKHNTFVGWVCIQAGSPGVWAPFGKIGN